MREEGQEDLAEECWKAAVSVGHCQVPTCVQVWGAATIFIRRCRFLSKSRS